MTLVKFGSGVPWESLAIYSGAEVALFLSCYIGSNTAGILNNYTDPSKHVTAKNSKSKENFSSAGSSLYVWSSFYSKLSGFSNFGHTLIE